MCMMAARSNFAENLKYLRKKRGGTQERLAEVLHIKRCKVASYEEKRAEPTLELLCEVSRLFRVPVDDLLKKKLYEQ